LIASERDSRSRRSARDAVIDRYARNGRAADVARVMYRRSLQGTAFFGYSVPVTRRFAVLLPLLLAATPASAAEWRAGLAFSGHTLFTDVAAASVQWLAVQRPERSFLRELDLETGLGLSFDGEFLEIPLLARFELYRWSNVGIELAPGFVVSRFEGSSALTPFLSLGVPVTIGRWRVQPELCLNASAGPPGGPSYMGGLWTNLGIGAYRAF